MSAAAEIELEVDVEPERPRQLERPLEQAARPLGSRRARAARRPAAAQPRQPRARELLRRAWPSSRR